MRPLKKHRKMAESEQGKKYINITLERDELAQNLGGGIPKGSLMLIEGVDGAGKSVFAQRLTFSMLENKATVTYISTELNTMSFVEQMSSLDYDVKKPLLNGQLLFLPMFPLLGYTTLESDFFDRLINSREVFRSEVIIFDTLSFLLIHNTMDYKEAFDIINKLKRFISMGKTILFFVDNQHLNQTFLTLLRSVCDIFMAVEIRSFAGQAVRVISTQRFKRPKEAFTPAIPFKIEPGRGLAVEIASFE